MQTCIVANCNRLQPYRLLFIRLLLPIVTFSNSFGNRGQLVLLAKGDRSEFLMVNLVWEF